MPEIDYDKWCAIIKTYCKYKHLNCKICPESQKYQKQALNTKKININ